MKKTVLVLNPSEGLEEWIKTSVKEEGWEIQTLRNPGNADYFHSQAKKADLVVNVGPPNHITQDLPEGCLGFQTGELTTKLFYSQPLKKNLGCMGIHSFHAEKTLVSTYRWETENPEQSLKWGRFSAPNIQADVSWAYPRSLEVGNHRPVFFRSSKDSKLNTSWHIYSGGDPVSRFAFEDFVDIRGNIYWPGISKSIRDVTLFTELDLFLKSMGFSGVVETYSNETLLDVSPVALPGSWAIFLNLLDRPWSALYSCAKGVKFYPETTRNKAMFWDCGIARICPISSPPASPTLSLSLDKINSAKLWK